jgi:hypothetical protein
MNQTGLLCQIYTPQCFFIANLFPHPTRDHIPGKIVGLHAQIQAFRGQTVMGPAGAVGLETAWTWHGGNNPGISKYLAG